MVLVIKTFFSGRLCRICRSFTARKRNFSAPRLSSSPTATKRLLGGIETGREGNCCKTSEGFGTAAAAGALVLRRLRSAISSNSVASENEDASTRGDFSFECSASDLCNASNIWLIVWTLCLGNYIRVITFV